MSKAKILENDVGSISRVEILFTYYFISSAEQIDRGVPWEIRDWHFHLGQISRQWPPVARKWRTRLNFFFFVVLLYYMLYHYYIVRCIVIHYIIVLHSVVYFAPNCIYGVPKLSDMLELKSRIAITVRRVNFNGKEGLLANRPGNFTRLHSGELTVTLRHCKL